MRVFTASNLVDALDKLPKNRAYDYAHSNTQTKVEIIRVDKPEGPIVINRYDPSKGEGPQNGSHESISTQMIWRISNAISEGRPINFERVLGSSYNTRSALEALLLHTPEFYKCMPGRIEIVSSSSKIKKGHKHVVWLPSQPHSPGAIHEIKTEIVVSEHVSDVVYEALTLPAEVGASKLDIELKRRHAQIQVALVSIGKQLSYRTWVAQNDKGIIYKNKKLGEMEGVISRLENELLLAHNGAAVKAASLIDCIWFRDKHHMPAVIEIEQSTGVTSGLTRMKNFYDHIPPLKGVQWVIAAPDEDRKKVMQETNKLQFAELDPQFLPYSAIEELFSLCQKRGLQRTTDEFLNCFMEPCLEK